MRRVVSKSVLVAEERGVAVVARLYVDVEELLGLLEREGAVELGVVLRGEGVRSHAVLEARRRGVGGCGQP